MNANETTNVVFLAEWECNYYDDSDFYGAHLNLSTGEVTASMIGTTRFASPTLPLGPDATEEQHEIAKAWGIPRYIELLRAEWNKKVRPTDLTGVHHLRLTEDVSSKDKNTGAITEAKAGEVGKIIWSGAFGTFFRNGYKRRDRNNIRVGLKFSDGRVVFTKLANTMLNAQEPSHEAFMEEALRMSKNTKGFWRFILEPRKSR